MTDKELLELAANAAGLNLDFDSYTAINLHRPMASLGETNWFAWNPLTDDGDALRLAVKLQIIVGRYDNYVNASPLHDGSKEVVIWNHNEKDHYAATRRAIVRAAAEIGKQC